MLRIAAVVLTYNSADDLPECLAGLIAQTDISLEVIIVDNASQAAQRERMQATFRSALPDGHEIQAGAAIPRDYTAGQGLFVSNDRNAGYSAGNNIGARLAVALGCQAILIINPDVRLVAGPDYVLQLSALLFSNDSNAVAASAIRTLSGGNENPMFEPSYLQELLAPISMLLTGLGLRRGNPANGSAAMQGAPKLSGCCFLIRSQVLKALGYFDEAVFLYCEEAILAAQIARGGWTCVYTPEIEALHAHRVSAKGDPLRRQYQWSRSRRYYHRRYLGYGWLRRAALVPSQGLMLAMTWLKSRTVGAAR